MKEYRFLFKLFLLVVLIGGCVSHMTFNKSFIINKMQAILIEGWKITEIKENQFPFDDINKGLGGYKITLEGKSQEITISDYGDNKGDWIEKEIITSPQYHIWFIPIKYKEIINEKYKEIIEYEEKLQAHRPFMHPYIIGETNDFVIYGTYETMGYYLVSEPNDFNWEIMYKKIIKEFNIK